VPPGATTLQVRVTAGSDDAEQAADGRVDNGSSDLEFVQDGSDVQTVGIRFASVAIPPGSTIQNAYLQLQVDEVTTAGTVTVTLFGQASNSAPTFAESDNNISSRPRTGRPVTWTIPAWTQSGVAGLAQRSPNLAAIIQDIINVGGWVSGRPIVLIITGTTGTRTAESFDGTSSGAPLLHVEFTPGTPAPTTTTTTIATPTTTVTTPTSTSTTSTTLPSGSTTLNIRVSVGADDAEENSSRKVDFKSSDLELVQDSNLQTVGIRFRNVTIPRNAHILEAYVQFQVDETGSTATNLLVQGELSPNSALFSTQTGNISGRTRTTASATWSAVPAWTQVGAAGAAQRTPDISAVIGEIVRQGTWNSNSPLSIIITGTGKRTAESYDGTSAGAPLLHVVWAP
jgi:hypothetical protein